ncbi:hypothetical protein [Burkholderia pseudomallei]|uniref:hypothetical protein n=1 Tax=Burkholderia pseudomallei TaxID=28450 RepID=UPI0012B37E1B|nr:hypothetical protein [Burkholderia pseudomallei]
MTTALIKGSEPIDVISASMDALLAVAFPRSRAIRYPLAVELSQQATRYTRTTTTSGEYHIAVFARSREQAARALAVTRALDGQKAEYFSRGKQITDLRRLSLIIDCFLRSCECTDPAAHCLRVIGNPFSEDGSGASISMYGSPRLPLYLWPCTFMLSWNTPQLQRQHPSRPEDQLQARAVAAGCDICPNFKPVLIRA